MKALVKNAPGYGNMRIEEVEEPKVALGEVLVHVKAAAICGTDLHIHDGTWQTNTPIIVGHEFSGEIVKLGNDVKNWKVGDRVVSETHAYFCGDCYYCKSGRYNLCPERKGLGYGLNGAFAKYLVAQARNLHRIPENLSYEEAAITEPTADVVHAFTSNPSIKPSDIAVILGPGPIGLLAMQVARAMGAKVIVSGLSKDKARLEVARQLEADFILNVEEEDLTKSVKDKTNDLGADVVLEASGSSVALKQSLEIVRKGGLIILIGLHSRPVELNVDDIILKEIAVRGTFVNVSDDWERALKLMSMRTIKVKPLITHKFLVDQWEDAFQLFREGRAIKALLLP